MMTALKLRFVKKIKAFLPPGYYPLKAIFASGDVVKRTDRSKKEIARGVSNYSSKDLRR